MGHTATARQEAVEERREVRQRFSGGVGRYRLPQGIIRMQSAVARSGLVGWNDRPRPLRSENFQRKPNDLRTSKLN